MHWIVVGESAAPLRLGDRGAHHEEELIGGGRTFEREERNRETGRQYKRPQKSRKREHSST